MKRDERQDSRTLSSDRWLSVAEVDQFKDEVKVNILPVLVSLTYENIGCK